jgi:N-acetylmuramoyl-L-alanine amidase
VKFVRIFATWLVLVSSVSAQSPQRAWVLTPDRPEPRAMDAYRIDGVDYLDVNEVARLFRATKYWRAELEKMVLKIDGRRVRLTVGSPYVYVEDQGFNLFAPVRWGDGRMLVPVRLATDVLDDLVPERVTWRSDAGQLRFDTGDPNILALDCEQRSNGTLVEVRLSQPLTAEVDATNADRLVLTVPDGVISDGLVGLRAGAGLIDSLRCTQEPGRTVITLHHSTPVSGRLVSRSTPPRLVLAVTEGGEEEIPAPEFARGAAPQTATIARIVLDPGHGGSDSGVRSEGDVAEKDVTLAIALRARDLLRERLGVEVELTREDDRFRSEQSRAELANRRGADLFVSIHANGWFHPGMRGFSLGVHRAETGATVSGLAPWGAHEEAVNERSELFAEMLLERLSGTFSVPIHGVKVADYAALEGTTMTSVLLECGFLTNGKDASNLTDPDYQKKLAECLVSAVTEFRDALTYGVGSAP